jgi:hypothetical protein
MSVPLKQKHISPTQKASVLMKMWLDNQDIMILRECNYSEAIKHKKEIHKQMLAEGYKINSKTVPKSRVLARFGINEDYIFRLAEKEQRLGFTGKQ